jgi:hypothetical protein
MMSTGFICPHCFRNFKTEGDRNQHWGARSGYCYLKHQETIAEKLATIPIYYADDPEGIPRDDEPEGGYEGGSEFDPLIPMDEDPPLSGVVFSPPASGGLPTDLTTQDATRTPRLEGPPEDTTRKKFSSRSRWITYCANRPKILGRGLTVFEERRQYEKANSINPY